MKKLCKNKVLVFGLDVVSFALSVCIISGVMHEFAFWIAKQIGINGNTLFLIFGLLSLILVVFSGCITFMLATER